MQADVTQMNKNDDNNNNNQNYHYSLCGWSPCAKYCCVQWEYIYISICRYIDILIQFSYNFILLPQHTTSVHVITPSPSSDKINLSVIQPCPLICPLIPPGHLSSHTNKSCLFSRATHEGRTHTLPLVVRGALTSCSKWLVLPHYDLPRRQSRRGSGCESCIGNSDTELCMSLFKTVKEIFIPCLNNQKGRGKYMWAGKKRRASYQDRWDPRVLQPCEDMGPKLAHVAKCWGDPSVMRFPSGHLLPVLTLEPCFHVNQRHNEGSLRSRQSAEVGHQPSWVILVLHLLHLTSRNQRLSATAHGIHIIALVVQEYGVIS